MALPFNAVWNRQTKPVANGKWAHQTCLSNQPKIGFMPPSDMQLIWPSTHHKSHSSRKFNNAFNCDCKTAGRRNINDFLLKLSLKIPNCEIFNMKCLCKRCTILCHIFWLIKLCKIFYTHSLAQNSTASRSSENARDSFSSPFPFVHY